MPPDPDDNSRLIELILKELQEQLGLRKFQNCFGNGTKLDLHDADLIVHVQGPYLVKWIQKQYGSTLGDIAARILGPAARVRYEVGQRVELSEIPSQVAAETKSIDSVSRTTEEASHSRKRRFGRRQRTLSEFVVGACNELAMAGVHQILSDPGTISPLYLHSSVGNGKSHLLEAIRLRLRQTDNQLNVLVLTAEHFANYFTQALGAKSLPSFRQRFRSVDVLMIDDVDFLDGKSGIQEELLHTLKPFEQSHRQVVLTANRHPQLLTKTSPELISRFASGLVCRLESPDEETRVGIVRRHMLRQQAKFPTPTVEYIASRFRNNGRELEGAVNILATWAQMSKKTVTVSTAQRLLSQLERDCMRVIRLSDIDSAVCSLFGIEEDGLKSKSKKRSLAQPRMLAMYLARVLTQSPYSEIGEYFGGRIHSTVMSAEKKIEHQLTEQGTMRIASETWEIADLIETLKDRIRAG